MLTSHPLTSERISASRDDWKSKVGEEVFILDYERFFDQVLPHYMDSFHAVCPDGELVAHAFVEIVSRHGARKTKLMNVTVHPDFLPLDSLSNHDDLVKLYFSAIRATFELADTHVTSEVKIYGRSDHLLKILTITSGLLDSDPLENYNHVIQGRWLTFFPKTR